jgi:hypothetical protein
MNSQIQRICDRADLEEMRKIPPIMLPIKNMLLYLENKNEDYEFLLSIEVLPEIYYKKQMTMECISYLKKIQ